MEKVAMKRLLEDLHAKLLEAPSVEEVSLMKAKTDALQSMMRPVYQHDDDVDSDGHHHHEHDAG